MNVPGQNHRDPWFAAFFKDVLADSKFVFQTQKGTPFIFTGATPCCSLVAAVDWVLLSVFLDITQQQSRDSWCEVDTCRQQRSLQPE
jgi:hypothetical protein